MIATGLGIRKAGLRPFGPITVEQHFLNNQARPRS
jgi:hypothetical protein